MSQPRELIDRARFREVHLTTKDQVARNVMSSMLVVRASVRLVENQLKEGRLGEHTVICDEAVERGGTGKGPSPLEYLVASVGFWMLSQLTRYASVYAVPIYGCEIQLRGYFDQRGKLQLDDTPSGAQRLLYEVQLDSDAPEAQVRAMMRAVEQGCHARNTFAIPVEVRSTVKLNGRELLLGDWASAEHRQALWEREYKMALRPGDRFPEVTVQTVDGHQLTLPQDVEGANQVILFYRGGWWPYCRRQLADFQEHLGQLKENDIGVIALSADALDKARETVEQQTLEFPVVWGLRQADGERVGAAWEGQRGYIQPAQFILNSRGDIMHTVYGEGPLGRIAADDVLRWVDFQRRRAQGA